MEDGADVDFTSVESRQCSGRNKVLNGIFSVFSNVRLKRKRKTSCDGGYSLVHDNTDCIIQQTLSKYDRVQLRIDLVLVENRKNRHRIRSRQRRSKNEALYKSHFKGFETQERIDVDQDTAVRINESMSE